jgi:hypothetical protein
MTDGRNRKLIDLLWRPDSPEQTSPVYALLDGARDRRIYPALQDFEGEYRCLYRGELSQRLRRAAPYLVRLAEMAPFTRWLVQHAWGESWGIFLQTRAEIEEVRRHFRHFLIVEDYRGKRLYFRYYDPRVLRVYLPTCIGVEIRTIFGPVTRYVVEDEDPSVALEFGFRAGQLVYTRHILAGERRADDAQAGS